MESLPLKFPVIKLELSWLSKLPRSHDDNSQIPQTGQFNWDDNEVSSAFILSKNTNKR
jgi:hypothetical protein